MYTITLTYDQTILNPIVFIFVILMGITTLLIDKDNVLIPLIFVACYITEQQRISIAGLDFNMIRVMLLFLFSRVVIKHEWEFSKLNNIDKVYITYLIANVFINTLLVKSSSAFINRLGFAFDNLGMYIMLRNYIINFNQVNKIVKWLAYAGILVAFAMLFEQLNGRNLFSALGGVPDITFIREGRLRSQGAFSHPIMAGTFGATMLPLIWGYSKQADKKQSVVIIGYIVSICITLTSNSSGPLFTLIAAIGGLFLWQFRDYMSVFRKTIFFSLLFLEIIMTGHIHNLIIQAAVIPGSTSYHRFIIIDTAINQFSEWMWFGSLDALSWHPFMRDVTNHYVMEGLRAGMINLGLFIAIFIYCYKHIGNAMKKFSDINHKKYIWALGSVLFAHNVSFIGATYFGQMLYFFYLTLALISAMGDFTIKENN